MRTFERELEEEVISQQIDPGKGGETKWRKSLSSRYSMNDSEKIME